MFVPGCLSGLSPDRELGLKNFSRMLVLQKAILIPVKHPRQSFLRKKYTTERFLNKDESVDNLDKNPGKTGLMCYIFKIKK